MYSLNLLRVYRGFEMAFKRSWKTRSREEKVFKIGRIGNEVLFTVIIQNEYTILHPQNMQNERTHFPARGF